MGNRQAKEPSLIGNCCLTVKYYNKDGYAIVPWENVKWLRNEYDPSFLSNGKTNVFEIKFDDSVREYSIPYKKEDDSHIDWNCQHCDHFVRTFASSSSHNAEKS